MNAIDKKLEQFNKKYNGYGIESIRQPGQWINSYYGDIRLLYVNMGDPYIKTLIYDTKKGKFRRMCIADCIEKNNL